MPSSRSLARLIVDVAQVRYADCIVELGPGTGVFTELIHQDMRASAKFIAIERNQHFVTEVSRRYPNISIYHDCATNTKKYLDSHGHTDCDCIVSGLPWSSFRKELQERLIDIIFDILRPGGRFVTFVNVQGMLLPGGTSFNKKLRSRFTRVEKSRTVWMNVPPSFVYSVVK